MAGLNAPVSREFTVYDGPFGQLARSQYKALAAMRWRMFRNNLRSSQGAVELGARTLAFAFYALMGLALSAGLGAGAYAIIASDKWIVLPALFWVVLVLWQVVPVTLASFQEHYDLGGLLRFPVGFGAFYLLHLIFGLVDASTIMGGLCCIGIWAGITVADPNLFVWAALALVMFAAFNILLVRAISAWIDRWLAQRRAREIVGALFFVFLLSLQLLNPAFHSQDQHPLSPHSRAASLRWLRVANSVQTWLPPGLAAAEVERAAHSHLAPALEGAAMLGIYVLGAGAVLGMRLHAEYRGENLGDAPSRKKAERRTRELFLDGSGPIAAVMEKELRTLLRAMPLIYGLAAPLLMVFVLSGVFIRRGSMGGHPMPLSLLISLAYAMVGFAQLFYNSLGPEGAGIQILFLSPTPIRTVMLAKNLFHSLLFLVDAAVVCLVASLRLGWPSPEVVAASAAWLLFALPVHLAAGNAFSLHMPYRMNLGRITRQRGSQASSLLSMLIQIGVLGIGAGIFALFSWFDRLWLAIPVFLIMAGGATLVWLRLLNDIDRVANRCREPLIGALARTE
jgi:ABC-2 type transport system permease protein